MPRVVITVVSLLAVLTHVGLGCCLHHIHAAEQQPQATACSAGHHHHGESAHHDHDGLPIDVPPHDDCHEAHCFATLATAAAIPDESDLQSAPTIDLALCASGGELATAAAMALAGEAPADQSRPLSLRAHLRFCVLLN